MHKPPNFNEPLPGQLNRKFSTSLGPRPSASAPKEVLVRADLEMVQSKQYLVSLAQRF